MYSEFDIESMPADTLVDRKRLTSTLSWLGRLRPGLCRAVPVAAVLCVLGWCYVSVRANFSWDDAEPEILNYAWRLVNGKSIYNGIDSAPFEFAIYPPIYIWILAFLLKFSGLSFLPAKLITFLSAISIGWATVRIGRAYGKSLQTAIWASFLLFLFPAFLYNSVRAHVQMLAVAFSIWSLVLFLRNRKTETLILSPLLAALAIYTKQTQVALPLAVVTCLLIRDRRRLVPYAGLCGIFCIIPLIWLQKATNGFFLLDTVQLARLSYSFREIPLVFVHHAGPAFIFIGIASLALWRRIRDGNWDVLDCYLGWTFIVTLISLGRPGAHGQYVVELLVVTVLYLVCVTDLSAIRKQSAAIALQLIILLIYTPAFILIEEGRWDIAANKSSGRIYSIVKSGSGPILSQQGSFALFGRGEIYIQLFHFSMLSRAGLWDQSLLLRDIEKRKFSWVVTEFPIERDPSPGSSNWERFTPEMLNALRKNYEQTSLVEPYRLYAPRPVANDELKLFRGMP